VTDEFTMLKCFDGEIKKWVYFIARVNSADEQRISVNIVTQKEFDDESAGENWAREAMLSGGTLQ
jgi:hypothetical protein